MTKKTSKVDACSEGGDHEFTPDFEYDSTGETINCSKCGEPEPMPKKPRIYKVKASSTYGVGNPIAKASKSGTPKLPTLQTNEEERTRMHAFRFRPEDFARWKKAADAVDMTMTEFLRTAADSYVQSDDYFGLGIRRQ